MRVSNPVRAPSSAATRLPIPPSRGQPFASRGYSGTSIVPGAGIAPSETTAIE